MIFKIESWFRQRDTLDYECFKVEAVSPKSAIEMARLKYPTAFRCKITKIK